MPDLADRRTLFSLTAAIWLGLIVALGAAGFDQYFKIPLLETGDVAVNALQVDQAKHFAEIYGNYSRFEFNHPGPAFFYVYAAGEWLLHDMLRVVPSPGNAHLLASMCLQSAFFALALAVIAAHVPWRVWLPMALLVAALHFGSLQDPFMSIWPPHVLLMPFLCFLATSCSVGSGRLDHLPLAVLAGGFLFHGHVAQPVFVGSLGALALGLAGRQLRQATPGQTWRQRVRAHRPTLAVSAALAGLVVLPLLIDVVTAGTRSNVATIIGRFYANTGDSKSILQSFLYFVSFATPARNQDEIFTVLGPPAREFFSTHAGRVALWGGIFLLPPALGFLWRSRVGADERRFLGTAHLFLAVAIGGCILWGMAQAGPMNHFNGYFYYGVYFFGLLLALIWLDRLVRIPGSPVLAAALCAIAAVASTWSLRLPRLSEAETGLPLKRAIEAALRADSRAPKVLVFEHTWWPVVAGVGLELQRQKVPFYLEPWWGFMFGARHELPRRAPAAVEDASVWWITNPADDGIPLGPDLSLFTRPAPINPAGAEISFRGGANGFRYLVSGLSVGNVEFAWTELPRLVLLFAPQPADHDVRLVFDAQSSERSARGAEPQPAVVLFNGRDLGRLVAGERAPLAVTIPRELWNSQPRAKIELRFPEARLNHSYKRPRHDWWTAWGLWAVRFEPAR